MAAAVERVTVDPRFLEHFQHPRNVGDLTHPDVCVEGENPVCGDRLRLALALEGETVGAVRYRVSGCSGAIAAASVMSELVQGRALGEVARVDRQAIDAALGGLPALKRHGADLAADTLHQALAARRAAPAPESAARAGEPDGDQE
ncbi:MAG: iron-sulfur cluster assembly scaffold protein [Planctomycetota bacterium]